MLPLAGLCIGARGRTTVAVVLAVPAQILRIAAIVAERGEWWGNCAGQGTCKLILAYADRMSTVILGPAGSTVLIDLDLCAKTGKPTMERVMLHGKTTPGWVSPLFIVSLIAFILGRVFTAKAFRVTVPFSHDAHDRWRNNRRWAGGATVVGALLITGGVASASGGGAPWFWAGTAILVVALVSGAVNGLKNNVGVWQRRGGNLVLTRVHPDFARAARAATLDTPTNALTDA